LDLGDYTNLSFLPLPGWHYRMSSQELMKVEIKDGVATLTFLPESGASGRLILDVDQLTRLIQSLGKTRAAMNMGKPIPEVYGVFLRAVVDTKWYTESEGLTDGSLLAFQHPEFGPVGFVLPRDQVAYLVSLLTSQLQNPPLSAGTKN